MSRFALLAYKSLFENDAFVIGPFETEKKREEWEEQHDTTPYSLIQVELLDPDEVMNALDEQEGETEAI